MEADWQRLGALSVLSDSERQAIQAEDLLEVCKIDIYAENVRFLLALVEQSSQGTKKKLAEELGLATSSISKWMSGKHQPNRPNAIAMCQYFCPYHSCDLDNVPLFLSPSPVDAMTQRAWLIERVKAVGDRTLQKLFPALEKLFRED